MNAEVGSWLDRDKVAAARRRERLLGLRGLWLARLVQLEERAVDYFHAQELPKIADLIVEKHRVEMRVARLDEFMARHLDSR